MRSKYVPLLYFKNNFCLCNLVFINTFAFSVLIVYSLVLLMLLFSELGTRKVGMIICFTSEGVELPVC